MVKVHSCLVFVIVICVQYIPVYALRVFNVDGEETILAFENENINIQCQSDTPMNYCGFVHPSGKRFSFSDSTVNDGKCVHKVKANLSDSGEWKCHIGLKSARLEVIKKIQVRIVNQLAAIQPNITTKLGKPVTIACATTKGYVPLSYCRFEPPNGRSFSIDSSIDYTNAILRKYYFPVNNSLDRGDCAVTISHVKYEDAGIWTCGAGLDDGNEHIDQIMVEVEGMYNMSTASTTGITIAVIAMIGTLATLGYVAWKKKRLLGGAQPENIEIQDIQHREQPVTPQPERSVPRVEIQSPSEPSEGGSPPS